jgi:hypothetical protein
MKVKIMSLEDTQGVSDAAAMIVDDVKAAIGVELTKKRVSSRLDALKRKDEATVTGPLSDAEQDKLLKAAKKADEKLAGAARPLGFWVAIRDEHFFGRDVRQLTTRYKGSAEVPQEDRQSAHPRVRGAHHPGCLHPLPGRGWVGCRGGQAPCWQRSW